MMEEALYSIGELATRTGIAPDTIRIWERRYGRPESVRLPSGHRRYRESEISYVRRVAEAMAFGHRPGRLMQLSPSELDSLLQETAQRRSAAAFDFATLHEAVARFRRDSLRDELLRQHRAAHDPVAYFDETLGPFLTNIGSRWAEGSIAVRHEHFLSEAVDDVLRTMRVRLEQERDAANKSSVHFTAEPKAMLATLPGERHGLGLQMAALALTMVGYEVINLGVEVPIEEIEAAVFEAQPVLLALSISLATGGLATDRNVRRLRAVLPSELMIAVGGAGARRSRRGVQGVRYFADLHELVSFLDRGRGKRAREVS